VIFAVGALVATWWSNRYLRCCCVPLRDALEDAFGTLLNSDLLSPRRVDSVPLIWCCRIGEEDDNEEKWEA